MFYHLKLSDGRDLNVEANSASEAIGLALDSNKGKTVVRCFVGGQEGRITFDIPPHAPVPKKIPSPKKPKPVMMFDDEEIKRESIKAIQKASY